MDYQILCVDENNEECHISFHDLLNMLRKEMADHCTVSYNQWMCKLRYFFNYEVVVDTNIGPFQKLDETPAIITYAKYNTDKGTIGSVIFLSKEANGVLYANMDGHISIDIPSEYKGWRYSLIENCRLSGSNEVKSLSNKVYKDIYDVIDEILNTANIRPAEIHTRFPATGDYAILGGLMGSDMDNPKFAIDTEGNIYCNSIHTREVS